MIKKAEELILNESGLKKFRDECKKSSKRIVLLTGVFDILHPGHLKFLEESKECGDVLIVGVDTDALVKEFKGERRPILGEYDRAHLLAGFECVSCVHIFSDHVDLIRQIKPDVYIMSAGSIRKPEERTEIHEAIREVSGQVIVFDEFSTIHSSEMINKMNKI